MPRSKRSSRLRDSFGKRKHKSDDSFPDRRRIKRDILHGIRGDSSTNVNALVYKFLGNLGNVKEDSYKKNVISLRRKLDVSPRSIASCCNTVSESGAGSQSSVSDVHTNSQLDVKSSGTAISTSSSWASEPVIPTDNRVEKTMLKKRSFLQVLNRYIRAGLEEGKRRAKRYVAKALSFALDSGYLIPAGNNGKLLRVSPTLTDFKPITKPIDIQATVNRIQRRHMRKRKHVSDDGDDRRRPLTRLPSLDNSSVKSKKTDNEEQPETNLSQSDKKKAVKNKHSTRRTWKKKVKFPPSSKRRGRKSRTSRKKNKRYEDSKTKRRLRNRSKTPGRVLENRKENNSDTRPDSQKSNGSDGGHNNEPEKRNSTSSNVSSRSKNREDGSHKETVDLRDDDETHADCNND